MTTLLFLMKLVISIILAILVIKGIYYYHFFDRKNYGDNRVLIEDEKGEFSPDGKNAIRKKEALGIIERQNLFPKQFGKNIHWSKGIKVRGEK